MKVLRYFPYAKGDLVGFLTLQVPKWGDAIVELKVSKKDKMRWVNVKYEDKEVQKEFNRRVLKALDDYLEANESSVVNVVHKADSMVKEMEPKYSPSKLNEYGDDAPF